MAPLPIFSLPLPTNAPPAGYDWEEREISDESTSTAFNIAIDDRDTFLGELRCIICGGKYDLRHCQIIRDPDPQLWSELKDRYWISPAAKTLPAHEPRNGLLMCPDHHASFNAYAFFIRFFPDTQKFVFVNYINRPNLQQFHGKAIAVDIRDHHAPFPSLFITHEMRVRGFHPFEPPSPAMPDQNPWQDWILSDGVFDDTSGVFKRDSPPSNSNNDTFQSQIQFQPMAPSADTPSGRRALALNANVVEDILAATHAMPSWRACQLEGTSWRGTADENIEKYKYSFGTPDT